MNAETEGRTSPVAAPAPLPPRPEPPRPTRRRLDASEYVRGVLNGERSVLSRAITLIESRRPDDRVLAGQVLAALLPHTGRSTRVGISGMPGAGKSTLIETLGLNLTRQGRKVAVLAVDPSSRVTGGSLLGDKTRMTGLSCDPNAFIRPSPSGETLGGVARTTREAMLACEAAGFDVVIVETVGVGQAESVVADMVDVFLVVLIAGAGDQLQGIKRGILEVADLIAVNKADGEGRPRATRAAAMYRDAMRLLHPPDPDNLWSPPVLALSALENQGVDALWDCVLAHRATFEAAGLRDARRHDQAVRWMWDLVDDQLHRILREDPRVRGIAGRLEADVRAGRVTASAAAASILVALGLAGPNGLAASSRPHG
jgi:LAO/AO transport system kinase